MAISTSCSSEHHCSITNMYIRKGSKCIIHYDEGPSLMEHGNYYNDVLENLQ